MALIDGLNLYYSCDALGALSLDPDHGGSVLNKINSPTSVAGKLGNAIDFDAATSDGLTAPSDADNNVTGDFTISCWAWLDAIGAHRGLVTKDGVAAASRQFLLYYYHTAQRLRFGVSADGTVTAELSATSFGLPPTITWLHILARHRNGTGIDIRVNAGAVDSLAHAGGVFSSASAFRLGIFGNGTLPHEGRIDEVGLWSRYLSDAEGAELYNGGAGVAYPFATGRPAALKRRRFPLQW